MTRAVLCLAIVAVPLAVPQDANCRPPDKVVHSPVPPLKQPHQQRSAQSVQAGPRIDQGASESAQVPIQPPAAPSFVDPYLQAKSTPPHQHDSVGAHAEEYNVDNYRQEQLEIWNSSEMQRRDAVLEFCRHSAQTSLAEGQQYLEQLSQLSPEEMRNWLNRFQLRRMSLSGGREADELARQLMLEYSISHQEARRQSALRIAEIRTQAAAQTSEQGSTAQQLHATRYMSYKDANLANLAPNYDPLEVVLDPSSPRGYKRRVAAAMSLPGDLPRGDPRNFIRGEEGVDFGEWATTFDAEPPSAPVVAGDGSTTGQ